jgi:hypothetical protein
MGTTTSLENNQITTQRIRPVPGMSGYKNRRGTLSIYSDSTHTIYTVQTKENMTIWDIKKQLPLKNIELKVDNKTLKNSQSLSELGIDSTTPIKIVSLEKHHVKSNSTSDTFPDSEGLKIIGPKKQVIEKPLKPSNDSTLSIGEEKFNLNLKSFAVPDIKLVRNYSKTLRKA